MEADFRPDAAELEYSTDDTMTIVQPNHVVEIGASAGGLESLEKLFRNLPADTGMAFVVLQHLSPDFKSMMLELLGRDTTMTIHRAEDGMPVEADSIYLLPPKKEMTIADGRLRVTDKDRSKGLALPIDMFLESLARECGSQAIAIILSGSGSDGSRGVLEIARQGGFVISESPQTAKFDGMPASAQASGVVDEILMPEEIGQLLVRIATEPGLTRKERIVQEELRQDSLQGMDAIDQLFRRAHDIDFSVYKDTTVLRRIHRRVTMVGAGSVDEYARKLHEEPQELDALYGDLLIGVTQFFRDPETYSLLCQTIFPEIVNNRDGGEPIRAWVAGCATGEEPYSLAIAIHEAFEKAGRTPNLKLFATDVHKSSLEHAGRGIYPAECAGNLLCERARSPPKKRKSTCSSQFSYRQPSSSGLLPPSTHMDPIVSNADSTPIAPRSSSIAHHPCILPPSAFIPTRLDTEAAFTAHPTVRSTALDSVIQDTAQVLGTAQDSVVAVSASDSGSSCWTPAKSTAQFNEASSSLTKSSGHSGFWNQRWTPRSPMGTFIAFCSIPLTTNSFMSSNW